MLMDVSNVVNKLRQKQAEKDKVHKERSNNLNQVTKELNNKIKLINIENNKELDDYLNRKLQDSIDRNVYTFSLDRHDFNHIYNILNVKEMLTAKLLKAYNDCQGSQYSLDNRIYKTVFKKLNKYINKQNNIKSNFMTVDVKEYELMVYISL